MGKARSWGRAAGERERPQPSGGGVRPRESARESTIQAVRKEVVYMTQPMPVPSAGSRARGCLRDAGTDQAHQLAVGKEGIHVTQASTKVDGDGQQPMPS